MCNLEKKSYTKKLARNGGERSTLEVQVLDTSKKSQNTSDQGSESVTEKNTVTK